MTRISIAFLLFISLNLLTVKDIQAELSLHGFVQGNYSARITGEESSGFEGGDFLIGEERIQIEMAHYGADRSGLFAKADFFQDSILHISDLEIREAYISYGKGDIDIRVGRQIITWGVGDLLFINDVFPKDWNAFFSGRPVEYLKRGIDTVKLDFYTPLINGEFFITPFFEPDIIPDGRRFFLYNPYLHITDWVENNPAGEVEKLEAGVRLYRYIGDWDVALYLYRGFWRQPTFKPIGASSGEIVYPDLYVYGMTMQSTAYGGVVSIESGLYDFPKDRDGANPFIPNSQFRYLVGYQRQLGEDFTSGIQYYGEYMGDYKAYRNSIPSGGPVVHKVNQILTLRLTHMFRYNTLRLSLFTFYGIDNQDYFIIPEMRYNITDSMWTSVGFNIFGGRKEWTLFGQHENNDNLYVNFRYEF